MYKKALMWYTNMYCVRAFLQVIDNVKKGYGYMSKLRAFFQNPEYFITSPAAKGYLDWVPDALYLKMLYRAKLKKKCDLKKPVLYNEKLQWIKLHDRKDEYRVMVDKYEVRAYITDKIGGEYLIPCYGVFNSWEEIDFDKLPSQFVIKCTHDSGSVEICRDKDTWDKNGAEARIKEAMRRNYYKAYREWPYKDVPARIIIEKYMTEGISEDLKDYKVMCFNGRALVTEVHENRFIKGELHTQTFYDRDWKPLPIEQLGLPMLHEYRDKPACMDEIFRLSEMIAEGMYHVRVDWYVIEDRIYFGEITFFDGSGFEVFLDEEQEKLLGDMIHLPTDDR